MYIYLVDFWDLDAIKAFLSGVHNDKMVVVDVNSVGNPAWLKTDSFYGKPFIYCLEHNFGGMRGIYGNMATVASDPINAAHYKNSTLAGVGLTPEAIEQNPVIYDMMVRIWPYICGLVCFTLYMGIQLLVTSILWNVCTYTV